MLVSDIVTFLFTQALKNINARPMYDAANFEAKHREGLEGRAAVRGIAPMIKLGFLTEGDIAMLYWALVFFVFAIVAAVLGFGGIAGAAASIAQILFFIFLVLFLVSVVVQLTRGRTPPV